jgi:hypothetical protein
MLKRIAIASVLVASLLPGPALAEKKQAPVTTTGDPNERICETIPMIGSRLATKRFCGTRAEWDERRRQDREALDAAQKGPCQIQTTGATGRPSC